MTDTPQAAVGSREDSPVRGTTYFDRDGELRLEVGRDSVECVVCPRALARASPVFKKMLYGSFKESKPSKGGWVVKLPADDPEALMFVLHIVHGQFDKIPSGLSEEKLYGVTVITDKYDLTSCLRPWKASWLQHLQGLERNANNIASRIWIAWELGDEELFRSEARWLIVNSDSELFYGTRPERNKAASRVLDNLGILSHLRKQREDFNASLVMPVERLYHFLIGLGPGKACTGAAKHNPYMVNEPAACRAVLLASFIDGFHDVTQMSAVSFSRYLFRSSPRSGYLQLRKVATSIRVLETRQKQEETEDDDLFSDHSRCNPKDELLRQLERAYNMPLTLPNSTLKAHLKLQAAKTRMPVS